MKEGGHPMTECNQETLRFQEISGKRVEAKFDGGMVSTEAGALILREVCKRRGIFERLKDCFTDYRNPSFTIHSVQALLEQRIYGLACGYEDLNDHDILRQDAVFQLLIGKQPELEPKLAGRNTLNRLELSGQDIEEGERYKKISCNDEKLQAWREGEPQFQLFSYRLSSGVKRANQLRLWFSTLAYLILVLVKKYALKNTPLANAEVLSIRLKLIKLAAKVTVSARRVYLSLAQGFPFQKIFATALKNATA